MTQEEIAAAVAQMQKKIISKTEARPEIWQNSNGTFSHQYDSRREWKERMGCETDLRFTKEWMR